jgi:hypothetical protein
MEAGAIELAIEPGSIVRGGPLCIIVLGGSEPRGEKPMFVPGGIIEPGGREAPEPGGIAPGGREPDLGIAKGGIDADAGGIVRGGLKPLCII